MRQEFSVLLIVEVYNAKHEGRRFLDPADDDHARLELAAFLTHVEKTKRCVPSSPRATEASPEIVGRLRKRLAPPILLESAMSKVRGYEDWKAPVPGAGGSGGDDAALPGAPRCRRDRCVRWKDLDVHGRCGGHACF